MRGSGGTSLGRKGCIQQNATKTKEMKEKVIVYALFFLPPFLFPSRVSPPELFGFSPADHRASLSRVCVSFGAMLSIESSSALFYAAEVRT